MMFKVQFMKQNYHPPQSPSQLVSNEPDFEDISLDPTELDVNIKASVLPLPPKPKDKSIDEEPPPYVAWADVMPEIVGGIEELYKHILYPEIARRSGLTEEVSVLVFVDSEGNISKMELMKGIGGGCDEAVMEAIKKLVLNPVCSAEDRLMFA